MTFYPTPGAGVNWPAEVLAYSAGKEAARSGNACRNGHGYLIRCADEVERAFWFPLARLLEAERHVRRSYSYRGFEVVLPAIRVLEGEGPLLWGLTYRFLEIFLRLVGEELPPMPWPGSREAQR